MRRDRGVTPTACKLAYQEKE